MTTEKKEYTIDAAGKILGAVASRAANLLCGKGEATYTPNATPAIRVHIINVTGLKMSEAKRGQKIYERYSGHPGGLKRATMTEVIAAKGMKEVCRLAIYGMLPRTKHRVTMMKNLMIA